MKYLLLYLLCIFMVRGDLTGSVVLNSTMNQVLKLDINNSTGRVNIIFSGNIDGWFGVGFNNTDMRATYTIIVDVTGIIYEYYLGSGTCSPECDTLLKPTFYINSNTMNGNTRSINIDRSINDNSNGAMYFNFPTNPTNLQLIWAYGIKGQLFEKATDMAYHGETKINLS